MQRVYVSAYRPPPPPSVQIARQAIHPIVSRAAGPPGRPRLLASFPSFANGASCLLSSCSCSSSCCCCCCFFLLLLFFLLSVLFYSVMFCSTIFAGVPRGRLRVRPGPEGGDHRRREVPHGHLQVAHGGVQPLRFRRVRLALRPPPAGAPAQTRVWRADCRQQAFASRGGGVLSMFFVCGRSSPSARSHSNLVYVYVCVESGPVVTSFARKDASFS